VREVRARERILRAQRQLLAGSRGRDDVVNEVVGERLLGAEEAVRVALRCSSCHKSCFF
jgi:hypothetical protein